MVWARGLPVGLVSSNRIRVSHGALAPCSRGGHRVAVPDPY